MSAKTVLNLSIFSPYNTTKFSIKADVRYFLYKGAFYDIRIL